jgi:predicted transcriptional regulator of viral defense system
VCCIRTNPLGETVFEDIAMAKTRLDIAREDIVALFDSLPTSVLKHSEISRLMKDNRQFWRLAKSTTCPKFIEFLVRRGRMHAVRLEFPSRPEVRYIWGNAALNEVLLSLRPESFFSHYTAMALHELTDQIPKSVYVNAEQGRKIARETSLEQGRIAAAFARAPRISKNTCLYEERRIYLLNGKHTGNLGVIDSVGPDGETIRITDTERTLIDITVRPMYSGGVAQVLEAFRFAQARVSVNKLLGMLKKIDYVYPYHQAIGFYMDRAGGFRDSQIALLAEIDKTHDFYLTYQMKDVDYSEKWRLFFPKGF